MLALILLIAAGIFKAIADTLLHHFDTSIFKWKDPRFWNPAVSWKYVGFIKFSKYRPDAWHLANSGQIICFCLAIVLHKPMIHWGLELAISGVLFNLVFNLFYNKALRK
jgi:hypothetical protein